ncbi:unnamed protein product [Rotaria socialis]|uniref:Uncharacterized protein n=2 Tax=Rotaria socialis TaxID=392032 RepID=A0A821EN00_9BILA|nr:unnamed protein product [Rotaria socialis]CAF4367097.1 unnamed protein product [Rotaria socialis]CAF4417021.1 unnamed protein product [Rotaria socialis]CAF4638250.1 unnamed protein product [Rotaria socialis]CAF4674671.1 unnamed protein product [Rotaria socialis]
MASSTIPTHYPQLVDPTRTPLAFLNRAVPRLNRELQSDNLLLRQRAVRSLCDYLHDPEHILPCLNEDIPATLLDLLKDTDQFCRLKSAECYYVIAGHSIGRQAMLACNVIPRLASLFDDKEPSVRRNAHKAVSMYSEAPPGAQNLIEIHLVDTLLKKLISELDEIKNQNGLLSEFQPKDLLEQELILNTIHFCLMVDVEQALAADAMSTLTSLLKHPSDKIKTLAALTIFHLSVSLKGKERAVEIGTVDELVALLDSNDDALKSKSALALSIICIITPGKYCTIKAGAIPKLLAMLKKESTELVVNALKVIACIAEAPEGRKKLLESVDQIDRYIDHRLPNLAKHAQIASKVIKWMP